MRVAKGASTLTIPVSPWASRRAARSMVMGTMEMVSRAYIIW